MSSHAPSPQTDQRLGWIVLAVYAPEPHALARQLRSIASQTVTGWTCVVVVDGPDAGTVETVASSVGGDGRFLVVGHADRVGFYRNFERGLALVPPDAGWVALSDQDDEWFPDKLATLLPLLAQHRLASGQAHVLQDGVTAATTRRVARSLDALLVDNQITGSFTVFRRDLLELALPFPEHGPMAFHDHWLGVCAMAEGGVVVHPQPLQNYIQHSSNVIGEPQKGRFGPRMLRLATSSSGWRQVLVVDRLGWRREMARVLLTRGVAPEESRAALQRWASSRWPLLRRLVWLMLSHEVPLARAAALGTAVLVEPRHLEGDT